MDNQMGRHKVYRTPKRRGSDDDDASEDRFAAAPLYRPKPGGPPGWQSADAAVKWFNPEKGFGFITPDGGRKDVFVHITMIERSGLSKLVEGQRVRMTMGHGEKGPEAVSIKLLD